jgi:cell division protein FtsQ
MSQERFLQRRKSERRRRIWRILLSVLAVVVAGVLVWLFWFSSSLAVNHIRVEGVTTLTQADVRAAAKVRIGEPLIRVDTVAIETRVAALERVDRVEVSRRWPRTIRIEVTERRPIAWTRAGVYIRALDKYGVDFRTFRSEPKDLVEVVVETYSSRKRQQALESSCAVIELLRTEDRPLLKRVRYVRVSSKDSVQLVLRKNKTVTWGSAARSEEKLRVLRSLLKAKKARGYDVSAPEQPTTRR